MSTSVQYFTYKLVWLLFGYVLITYYYVIEDGHHSTNPLTTVQYFT